VEPHKQKQFAQAITFSPKNYLKPFFFSGSLEYNWDDEVELAKGIFSQLPQNGTRVGAVGYGTLSSTFFELQTFQSREHFSDIIENSTSWGGLEAQTHVGGGILHVIFLKSICTQIIIL
jgi:hypothetical protein